MVRYALDHNVSNDMNIFTRNKTFRPVKSHNKGTKRDELHKYAKATLGRLDEYSETYTQSMGTIYSFIVETCILLLPCQKTKSFTSGLQ